MNSEKVANLPVVQVREKIVGPTGTTVAVLFKRPNGDFYEVSIQVSFEQIGPDFISWT